MSIPKEPRQIMINLMYLVLTAMLALNISSEILHAFKIINGSLVKSNGSIDAKNNETLLALQANEDMEGHKERVKPFNDRAKEVHEKSAEVYKYLEEWKTKIVNQAGGFKTGREAGEIKNEENIDASTYMLVEQKGGDQIKAKLKELRDFMLARVNPAEKAALEKDLPIQTTDPAKTEDNPNGDWSTGTFYHVPTLGVIALMSKLQSDVRNSESVIMNQLFKEADAQQIKFDAITALAVPQTSYALQGQEVKAQIMVAAYNKSVNPSIRANTGSVKVNGGIGEWTGTASGVGVQTVSGTLNLNLGDRPFSQPWKFQYVVGTAGASLQLDKMNVFYIGVPNPITVTAAGYSLEDVSISIPGANLTPKGNGKYDVMVSNPGDLTATINAKTQKGTTEAVGGMKVRVKTIPDPIAKLANKTSGAMRADIFRAQLGIAAVLENFDFEAKFTVTSFDMSFQQRKGDLIGPVHSNSALFSGLPAEGQKYQSVQARPGDRVYLENIRAIGPDKKPRILNSIILILQ